MEQDDIVLEGLHRGAASLLKGGIARIDHGERRGRRMMTWTFDGNKMPDEGGGGELTTKTMYEILNEEKKQTWNLGRWSALLEKSHWTQSMPMGSKRSTEKRTKG